jgi:hypothetical protein
MRSVLLSNFLSNFAQKCIPVKSASQRQYLDSLLAVAAKFEVRTGFAARLAKLTPFHQAIKLFTMRVATG